MDIKELKITVADEVLKRRGELERLSLDIHSCPELGFKEEKAAERLTGYLEENGFEIERGIADLPTAFRAVYGTGKPNVGLVAEYDALPELGHACGHNIIATSSVGAAVAAKAVADECGGRVTVIGTPAEELYGGKVFMVERGAFEGLDAAMIVHPGTSDSAVTEALAVQGIDVAFFGKPAHAAASPDKAINALDAMILSFNAINSMRQHIRSTARVHGIITSGGDAANVVPAYSSGSFLVRAMENDYLDELKERLLNCFRGAALATGARLEYRWDDARYDTMRTNMVLAGLFMENMKSLRKEFTLADSDNTFGSTDMGNVSHVVPSIHAFVSIAGKDVQLHTSQFAEAAVSERGLSGILDASRALAMTVADLIARPDMMSSVQEEFRSNS